MSEGHHMVPVWFFVGVILLIYGVLILATGLYEFSPAGDRACGFAPRSLVGSAAHHRGRRLRLPVSATKILRFGAPWRP